MLQLILAAVVVVGFTATCVVAVGMVRRWLGPDVLEREQRPIAEFFMVATASLFGVLVAFVLEASLSRYREIREDAIAEVSGVWHLGELAHGLPSPAAERIRSSVDGYLQAVEKEEWASRGRQVPSARANSELANVEAILLASRPTNPGEANVHAEALRATAEVRALRDRRVVAAKQSAPALLWAIMIFGCVYMMATSTLSGIREWIHKVLVAGLAILTSLSLVSIYLLIQPFASVPWSRPAEIVRTLTGR